jgi:hypothetical protein
VHQSWQEQQQQLLEQQRQMYGMVLKLEDLERRFWNVTELLVLQTNELANERQVKGKKFVLSSSHNPIIYLDAVSPAFVAACHQNCQQSLAQNQATRHLSSHHRRCILSCHCSHHQNLR